MLTDGGGGHRRHGGRGSPSLSSRAGAAASRMAG